MKSFFLPAYGLAVDKAGGVYDSAGRRRKNTITYYGYEMAVYRDGEKYRRIFVHRLVGLAFIPNPDDKPFINHLDGNRLNNRVENLEWCTSRENSAHMIKLGRRGGNRKRLEV